VKDDTLAFWIQEIAIGQRRQNVGYALGNIKSSVKKQEN
jgi:hypothetical protein